MLVAQFLDQCLHMRISISECVSINVCTYSVIICQTLNNNVNRFQWIVYYRSLARVLNVRGEFV